MQGELTCSTGVPQPNQAWRECWAGMATPTPSGYAVTPPTLIGPKVTGHLTLGEKCGSHTHYAQHLITVQDKPALEQQQQNRSGPSRTTGGAVTPRTLLFPSPLRIIIGWVIRGGKNSLEGYRSSCLPRLRMLIWQHVLLYTPHGAHARWSGGPSIN